MSCIDVGCFSNNSSIFVIQKKNFEKAFDSVNWGYLDLVTEQMRFSNKWRGWIHGCLTSSRTSVLVNGAPTEEFAITKGVRRSDPLSSFLFIIAMEGLNQGIKRVLEKELIVGVTLPNNGPSISRLFYADDAIFVGRWDISSIKNLARILKCFYICSGLKVNFQKSRLFGIGIPEVDLQHQAQVLGCLKGSFPFTYLGVPVGANIAFKKYWRPIIDKFQS